MNIYIICNHKTVAILPDLLKLSQFVSWSGLVSSHSTFLCFKNSILANKPEYSLSYGCEERQEAISVFCIRLLWLIGCAIVSYQPATILPPWETPESSSHLINKHNKWETQSGIQITKVELCSVTERQLLFGRPLQDHFI